MNINTAAEYICNYPDIYVDNLKLQKLLFYAQAVSLVLGKKPLFQDKIEAWDYGPVVPCIYRKYKKYDAQIPKKKTTQKGHEDPECFHWIDLALSHYGDMTGSQLITLTHSEKPWQTAYAKGRNTEITKTSIKAFYSKIFHYA
ncbi:MAG: DUF4065 domain-containing protein [Treponema sp.]|nr:DUF4065 domain-containing protein [Treponema sp.]